MAKAPLIFVGFEVDGLIAQALAECREADRLFIEDPTYLEQAQVDGRRYIGKRLGDNAGLDRIDDAARNVASLLGRISPALHLEVGRVRLVAGETDAERPAAEDDDGDRVG
ncbi:MAG TPA: hypothetical protein VM285_02700 [Polyangia bacterium]|nr:hypothetical protein [Polyangia bacterium]